MRLLSTKVPFQEVAPKDLYNGLVSLILARKKTNALGTTYQKLTFQANKLETLSLREETAEELAQVISPEPKHRNRTQADLAASSPEHVTLLSVTHDSPARQEQSKC